MACKDTSIAKQRILKKQQECEKIKMDIISILDNMTENANRATQTILDDNTTNNRRRFRSTFVKADQTVEACLLKLLDTLAYLQNQSDDESGSDHFEEADCQSIISDNSTQVPQHKRPLINGNFDQNTNTSSTYLSCALATSVSSNQQTHHPSDLTDVVPIQDKAECLDTIKNVGTISNWLISSDEPTKQAAYPNKSLDDNSGAIFPNNRPVIDVSVAIKQNYLKEKNSQNVVEDSQSSASRTTSGESEVTITNGKLTSEDACSYIGAGCGVKSSKPFVYNQADKLAEGLTHPLKEFNHDVLANTLDQLTEPKDSDNSPETERFQDQMKNIYNDVAPNVSSTINTFNPISLMTTSNLSMGQSPVALLTASFGQISPISKQNCTRKSLDFGTSNSAAPSNEVPSQGYNYGPFTMSTAVTVPTFSGSIFLAEQKIRDVQLPKKDTLDFKTGQDTSQSNPMCTRAVQEKTSHGNVAPGFPEILTPIGHVFQDFSTVASAFNERKVSPPSVEYGFSDSAALLALPQLQFDDGSIIIASVEHVNSPSSFYIRPNNNDISLAALTKNLSNCYDGSYLELFTGKATVGLVCCALSCTNNTWYRAVITKIHRPLSPSCIRVDESVTVRFVDVGKTETLPLYRLRRLKEKFFTTTCLVVHCTLHNAKPPQGQTDWTEEQIETFSNMACRNDIKAKVHSKLVTGELDVELMTLEKTGMETTELSVLTCLRNAKCCYNGISNATEEILRGSPDKQAEPDENKNEKKIFTSFTIKNTRNPLLDNCLKKKPGTVKSRRRNYRTTQAFNETSGSDDDKSPSAPTLKPPICWEDLYSQGSISSAENVASISNVELKENSPTLPPFPMLRNIELNLSDFDFQDAMLAHVNSPAEFYVHPVVEEATCIDELSSDLNKVYSKAQAPLAIVDVQSIPIGSFWCAKFPVDGRWYRAKILDVKEIEDPSDKPNQEISKKSKKKLKTKLSPLQSKFKVYVFYVDHGDSAWIESNDLRQLKKKFFKHPALAVRCSLMSVYPKRNPNAMSDESTLVWPLEAGKALQAWAGETPFRIQVFNAKEFEKTGEYQVLLWNLENEASLFNEDIVKMGLADSNIYGKNKKEDSQYIEKAKEQNKEDDNLDLWDPMTADFQDLRNSYNVDVDDAGVALTGYKARDESKICHFYLKGQQCKRGSNCPYEHIKPSLDHRTTDKKAVMCSSALVSLPSIGNLVAVEITEVMTATHFYVNFPFSSESLVKLKKEANGNASPIDKENLTTLQTALQKAYTDQFPRDGDYLLRAEGEIVVAKFSIDKEWYRARVILVDPKKSSVKVCYVDYGNCEWVDEINIRDIRPEFMHFPFQAVECHLANLELITNYDGEPRKDGRAFFKNQVENRNLVAHIKDVIGNTLYIDLFYTENETDVNINLALVTMGYTRFVIGAKSSSTCTSKKINIMPA